jgi:hypothetical protein
VKVPKPYIRWNGRSAIVVAANGNTNQDATLKLSIPLREIGLAGHDKYKVTDIWLGEESRIYSEQDLTEFVCVVKRDKAPQGGLRIFKIEPASRQMANAIKN